MDLWLGYSALCFLTRHNSSGAVPLPTQAYECYKVPTNLLLGEINLSIPFRGRGKGMEEGGRVTRE